MAAFRFVAIDPAGKTVRGTMDAATEAEVVARLQRGGSIPVRAEPARGGLMDLLRADVGGRGIGRQAVADLTRELSVMLGAGQDLDRSLRFMAETAPNARVRAVVEGLRAAVRDGGSLAAALAAAPAPSASCTSAWSAPGRPGAAWRRPWTGWRTCWSGSGRWPPP